MRRTTTESSGESEVEVNKSAASRGYGGARPKEKHYNKTVKWKRTYDDRVDEREERIINKAVEKLQRLMMSLSIYERTMGMVKLTGVTEKGVNQESIEDGTAGEQD